MRYIQQYVSIHLHTVHTLHAGKAYLTYWDSQEVLIDPSIEVQHLVGLPYSFFFCGEGMVPFLP